MIEILAFWYLVFMGLCIWEVIDPVFKRKALPVAMIFYFFWPISVPAGLIWSVRQIIKKKTDQLKDN